MCIRHGILGLVLICVQFFGTTVHAVVLPFDSVLGEDSFVSKTDKAGGKSAVLLPLLEDSLLESSPLDAAVSGKELDELFRKRGDLGIIAHWAPKLMERYPEDVTLRALYAVALASQGHVADAQAMLSRFGDREMLSYRYMTEALIARREGNFDKVVKLARKAIAENKSHPFPFNILGRVYVQQGEYAKARDSFHKAVELAPEYAAAHVNLGAVEYALGQYAAAAESFSRAVTLAPTFCEARIGRSLLAEESRNYRQAITDLQACLQASPAHAEARKRLAYVYMLAGRLSEARPLAQEIAAEDTAAGNVLLGELYLRMNDPVNARRVLQKAGSSNLAAAYLLAYADFLQGDAEGAARRVGRILEVSSPVSGVRLVHAVFSAYAGSESGARELKILESDSTMGALARFLLANIRAAQGKESVAMDLWQRAEDFLPGFSVAGLHFADIVESGFLREAKYLNAGVLLYTKGLYPAAMDEFGKGVRVNSASAFGHYFTALTYVALDKPKQAQAHLRKSLEKAKNFFSANFLMAELLASAGDFSAAARYLETTTKSRADAGALIKLGLLQERLGNMGKAEAVYRRFIELYPDSFVGYNQLAWFYASRGERLSEALELAKSADRLLPGNAGILDTIGWIHFQEKRYQEAMDFLQKASLAKHHRDPQILYHLAAVQHAQGDDQAAKASLEQAFRLAKVFEGSEDARRLLSRLR